MTKLFLFFSAEKDMYFIKSMGRGKITEYVYREDRNDDDFKSHAISRFNALVNQHQVLKDVELITEAIIY